MQLPAGHLGSWGADAHRTGMVKEDVLRKTQFRPQAPNKTWKWYQMGTHFEHLKMKGLVEVCKADQVLSHDVPGHLLSAKGQRRRKTPWGWVMVNRGDGRGAGD